MSTLLLDTLNKKIPLWDQAIELNNNIGVTLSLPEVTLLTAQERVASRPHVKASSVPYYDPSVVSWLVSHLGSLFLTTRFAH